jgi:serine/threonine-protein kinase
MQRTADVLERKRGLISLFAGLLIAATWFVLNTTAELPAYVASHFRGDGLADGFMRRDAYRWFILVFAVGLPLLLVVLITYLPRRFPQATNIPNRDFWFAPERREQTLASLGQWALQLGCLFTLFACGVHWLVIQANARQPPRLANGPFLTMLVVFLVILGGWVVALLRRFRKPS